MAAEDDADVPESGAVFTFGKSKFGDNSPGKFWIREDEVVQVSCGDEHTALVAASGRLFTFGINEWGQLGLGHTNVATKPTRVKALKSEKVRLVSCGRCHTLIATDSGKLFTFGSNAEGQLGIGSTKEQCTPLHVDILPVQKYKMLAAGMDHSAALTASGDVYVWGGSSEGQLGIGPKDQVLIPNKLDLDYPIISLSCGYYHTAILSKQGDVYTFGELEDGKLGLGDDVQDHNTPQLVEGIEGRVTFISCGGAQTVAVTDKGKLYSFGDGNSGQLGHGTSNLSANQPLPVMLPKSVRIKYVSCGESHTAIISDKGQLFTFGDGRHGKLALGEENFANQFKPCLVDRFSKFMVQSVSCGGCHMLVIAKPKIENGDWASSEEDEPDSGEDQLDYSKPGDLNGIRNSMDLEGSIQARNRRRDRFPDTTTSLSRTLPDLDGTLSGHSLPPVSSSSSPFGAKNSDNPLNRGLLPTIHRADASSLQARQAVQQEDDDESDYSEEDEGEIQRQSLAPVHSAPVPKPRATPRVGSSPRPQDKLSAEELSDKDDEEMSDDGDEDKKTKPEDSDSGDTETKDSEEEDKPKPVPMPKLRVKRLLPVRNVHDYSDESEDEKTKPDSSESVEEDQNKMDKKQEKKKEKKKRHSIFGKKKMQLAEEEEEEEEEAEDEEYSIKKESSKENKKKVTMESEEDSEKEIKKDLKKKHKTKTKTKKETVKNSEKEDSSEEAKEISNKKKKEKENKKEKKVTIQESEDDEKESKIEKNENEEHVEDKNEKKKETEEINKIEEQKKPPPPEKKSKTCIIL